MKKLTENELAEIIGGAGKETVLVKMMIVWSGEAERRKNEVKSVKVRCWDADGIAYGTLTPANDWTCRFRVLKNAEFDSDMDMSAYCFVTKVEQSWNKKANLMIYYVS